MVGYLVLVRTCAASTSSPTTARASSASETGRISTCLKRLRSIPRITSTQSSGAVASCAGEARAAGDDLRARNLLLEEEPLQLETVPRDIAHGGEAALEQPLRLVDRAHGFQAHRLGHDADLLIVDLCAPPPRGARVRRSGLGSRIARAAVSLRHRHAANSRICRRFSRSSTRALRETRARVRAHRCRRRPRCRRARSCVALSLILLRCFLECSSSALTH